MTLAQQQAAALAETVAVVRRSLGLPASGAVPRDRLGEYMRHLSAEILAAPGDYSTTAVENARRYLNAPDAAPLEVFTIGDAVTVFSEEVVKRAGDIANGAAAVGHGVVSTAKLARWGIPAAAVAFIVLLFWREFRPAKK